jgi:uncharacterized protein (TIGR02145 family)
MFSKFTLMKIIKEHWLYAGILLGCVLILTNSCKKENDPPFNSVTDIDGNVYKTVTIGTQVWMAENLKVTHYRNGDDIPNYIDPFFWSNITTGAYSDYNNIKTNASVYGRLYNWYAVTDIRNICPAGWHIPSEAEWDTLTGFLGGMEIAGSKLKANDTIFWKSPNAKATNESGFNAVSGGQRYTEGNYLFLGIRCNWWSSDPNDSKNAWTRILRYDYDKVYRYSFPMSSGLSVRCIRD